MGHSSLGGLPSARCKGFAVDTAGLCWALLYQEGLVCVYRSSPSDGLLSPEKRDPDDGMEKQASSWARTLGQLFSFLSQEPPRRDEEVEAWRLVE